ncbi:hypothetical protein QBK99_11225 [Corticibacterium sp. UT-5YL-CI-8]|nr:hypothetical protein [Tianweitania sp. UT-5YL-CI-8]
MRRELPILFSAPMVRALIREIEHPGTGKTQTRRVISSARVFATPERPAWTLRGDDLVRALQNADRFRRMDGDGWFWEADAFQWQAPATRTGWLAHIGYAPGDCLYVREAWRTHDRLDHFAPSDLPEFTDVFYEADIGGELEAATGKFRQGMHMPRWASRITLTVTDVRVQRLQEISEADAIVEGCFKGKASGRVFANAMSMHLGGDEWANARDWYADLWDSLNAKRGYGWDANPWVVAITFTPIFGNIDQVRA